MIISKEYMDAQDGFTEYGNEFFIENSTLHSILKNMSCTVYRLHTTNYWVIINWKLSKSSWIYGTLSNAVVFFEKGMKFEDILNVCPKECIDTLLFNMDVFKSED